MCHVALAILVSASKLRFKDSYSDALALRSAKYISLPDGEKAPLSQMRGVKGLNY